MAECRQEKKGHSMLLSSNAAPAAAKQHIIRKGHFHSQREKDIEYMPLYVLNHFMIAVENFYII